MRAARRQVKSLKIPSAVYGGGSGAGRAGGGVSLGAAAAWPCRGVCCAGSGEPGELAGRSRGGPVAWACRGCAGGGERGELATRAGGGSESRVPRAGGAERDGGRRAEAEPTPRKCPLTGVLQFFFFERKCFNVIKRSHQSVQQLFFLSFGYFHWKFHRYLYTFNRMLYTTQILYTQFVWK